MDRTERFYRIDQLLRDKQVVPMKVLLEELEVSPATIKRDLEYLRSRFRAPIEWNHKRGGYYYSEPLPDQSRFSLPRCVSLPGVRDIFAGPGYWAESRRFGSRSS